MQKKSRCKLGQNVLGSPAQFSFCGPKPVMGNTLRCQVQSGGISMVFPANTCLDFLCRIWGKTFAFACQCLPTIAGREVFAVLEKPGGKGFPSRRVGSEAIHPDTSKVGV